MDHVREVEAKGFVIATWHPSPNGGTVSTSDLMSETEAAQEHGKLSDDDRTRTAVLPVSLVLKVSEVIDRIVESMNKRADDLEAKIKRMDLESN